MIIVKKKINITINKNSKIYINQTYDITIIEIGKEYVEYKELIFMDIDDDIFNSNDFLMKNFYKKKVCMLQYAKPNYSNNYNEKSDFITKKNIEEFTKDKDYTILEGRIIVEEDQCTIIHNIPTCPGSGGGPIISYDKYKVIGFHMGKSSNSSNEYKGIGIFLKLPIQEFIKKFYT